MPSVFEKQRDLLFTRYHCTIAFREKVLGGIPKDPAIIERWLQTKMGLSNTDEIVAMTARTLRELGVEVNEGMSLADMQQAAAAVAHERQTNGFKRDAGGLFIEDRQIKAMLKESVNILFAGDRWGKVKTTLQGDELKTSGKGPLNFVAERVFVEGTDRSVPSHIYLTRDSQPVMEPSGVEMLIVHTTGPQGPRSALGYTEFVEGAEISFDVLVTQDSVEHKHWPSIWVQAEENGLGAVRSQSFGRFDVTRWETDKKK